MQLIASRLLDLHELELRSLPRSRVAAYTLCGGGVMDDLRKRFGRLLAAHRRRLRLTQGQLAERAEVSVDMISKIEIGATGARFPVIERLSSALGIDPAELFTTEVPNSALKSGPMLDLAAMLAGLNREDQVWIKGVVEAAIKGR